MTDIGDTLLPADIEPFSDGHREAHRVLHARHNTLQEIDERVTAIELGGNPPEFIQDLVAAMMDAGANVDIDYDDDLAKLTFSVTGLTSATISDLAETIRDQVGATLVQGSGILITVNDAGDTITIATTGLVSTTALSLHAADATSHGIPAALATKISQSQADARYWRLTTALATQAALTTETAARTAADAQRIPLSQRGAANGVATLDGSAKIPTAQIPAITAAMVAADVATQAELDAVTAGVPSIEIFQDLVAGMLVEGTNIDLVYDDNAGTLTFSVAGLTTTSLSDFPEAVRDRLATTLAAGTGIAITVDDPGDTVTIGFAEAIPTQVALDAEATARAAADTTEIAARIAADALLIPLAQKGVAGGVANLDAGTKIPVALLPVITAAMVANDIATQTELDAEASARVSAINAEAAIRATTDTALDGRITTAEAGLTGKVDLDATVGRIKEAHQVRVTEVALPDTGFSGSVQEGGKGVMAGTITPDGTSVLLDIDLQGSSISWGGTAYFFHLGVLPDPPPTPWEPGGVNKIVKANSSNNSVLPGVTEYQYWGLGTMTPNAILSRVGRQIRVDGLTKGRIYTYEIRAGGVSYSKRWTFSDGYYPTRMQPTSDGLYVWAIGIGNASGTGPWRAVKLQLGWGELYSWFGWSSDMMPVGEVVLSGRPGDITTEARYGLPPAGLAYAGLYVAVTDITNQKLVIINGDTFEIVGSYAFPGGTSPATDIMAGIYGVYFYIGAIDGYLHRFNTDTMTFDQSILISTEGVPYPYITPIGFDAYGVNCWAIDLFSGKVYKIDVTATPSPTVSLFYTAPTPGGLLRGKVLYDGSLVLLDTANDRIRVVNAAGVEQGTGIDISMAPFTATTSAGSIDVDQDQHRVFWTNGGSIGWAWIDSQQVINQAHFNTFPDQVYGEVCNTFSEGTLLTLPTSDTIQHWPGGTTNINPSKSNPGTFGGEHLTIRCTGGVITRA